MQIAFGDRAGLAAGVVHHRVQVGDLAQAVAAQGQRGGHEAQAPLADVERGPAVVVGAGVAVRHHHLGEREPVRHRPQPPAVAESHLVQHQALAVVETRAAAPSPASEQPVPVQGEVDPLRLADLQGLTERSGVGMRRGRYSPITPSLGRLLRAVLELQQRHRVQVDDRMQPGDVMGVRVAQLAAPVPHVAPAEPQATVAFGDQRGPVGPHVGQHPAHVGDPAPRQRLGQRGVARAACGRTRATRPLSCSAAGPADAPTP